MINIKVNERCILDNYPTVSSGGVNDNELHFEFCKPAAWNGLTKVAIFTASEQSVRVELIEDKCYIPAEVLKAEGDITIGVYGYELVGEDTVALRRSPVPFVVTVEEGSYRESASEPTPQQADICEQALAVAQSVRADADSGLFNGADGQDGYSPTATVTQTASGATITITDKNGTTTANISNGDTGPQGPQGPQGPKGEDGDDYILTDQDKADIANIVVNLIPDGNEVYY